MRVSAPGVQLLENLLNELALILLPRGMTPNWFAELTRVAFVQAASKMSRLQNGRVNVSRVAAKTGLTRAEIARLLKYRPPTLQRFVDTAVDRVIEGWCGDHEFLTKGGRPKRLKLNGRYASFARLVAKCGIDIPPKAILDELRQIGAVRDLEGDLQLSPSLFFRRRHDFADVSPILRQLTKRLRAVSKSRRPPLAIN
jgi:Family of unknown function (DUF6502)